ncbi:aldehyde dehydrogenase family 3 member F1-like [Rhodamnia argentea]|uniref:Aldehyde dehydrogenase n=1 Tax=Rhodamnia argentea TaxID=178133 RepID=A0A8B8NIN8_9MYRT|nr:aldehyde dehydrogenase family 3 member F1-like [Rhodamnia argentea]XP_048140638.1 aldehyde dehydrogenase family 3 member F1-like [Rhodamnia argentea]
MEFEDEVVEEMERELEEMRECYRSGRTREASWRKSQLKGLLQLLREREEEIFRALHQDLGKHPAEAYRDEIGSLIKSLNYALDGLKRWMSGKKAKLPRIALLTSAEIVPEPLGLVLVISSWNFPIGLSLEPLIGALAAGNAVVLKPSELAPECSSLLANAIPCYLDDKAVKVVQGGPGVGEQLLHQKWDKIFFTGSVRIGRRVLAAAAEHLTPVTLELGGKCPAVVDTLSSSFDRKVAAQRVLGGKFSFAAGQVCIGVDYVLVDKKFSSTLVETMKVVMKKMFGENPRESRSVARIVNKHHFIRLQNLLLDPMVKSSIVYGGSMDEDNLFIEPTILMDPPLQAAIMTDEIFGPLLPIVTLNKIEDSIKFINSRPKPLAVYVFTKDESLRRSVVSKTSSGSVVSNDVVVQYLADTLPFGGIGESGMGRCHGKFSFDAFSHQKAVMRRSFLVDFWFRFPPWNDHKLQLFRSSYRYDYLGIVLTVLGLKKTDRVSKSVQTSN